MINITNNYISENDRCFSWKSKL